ncbi:MAG: heavy metal translocating P-type ATPase, partial [Firmicutes bacterium]|nr:heavy metal translocating P-type ATPase [Bacillota bacterium]
MNNDMNQKTYILENLGCANCAAKMERKIQDLPEVKSASITFATKQLRIEATDPEALVDEIQSICRSIEDEVIVVEKEATSHAHGVHPCDHSEAAKNSFFSGHKADIATLVVGAVLFAAGVVLEHVWGYDMWFAGGGRIVLLALTIFIAAYLILGHKVLLTALRNISHGQVFDENFLMSIATISAFCIGEYAEASGVMLFYRIGQLFEDIAVERSRSQIMEAVDMRPETVTLVAADEHYHDEHCNCGSEHD